MTDFEEFRKDLIALCSRHKMVIIPCEDYVELRFDRLLEDSTDQWNHGLKYIEKAWYL